MEVSANIIVKHEERNIEWLVDEYGKDLLHLVYCYVKDKSVAEDLLQEIYLTAYLKINSFEGKSSLKTWVSRIAINKCKDYLKTSYFKRTLLTNILEPFMEKFEKTTEDYLIEEQTSEWIANTVLDLPVKYREIIVLYYYKEYSIPEICELLDMKESTLKSRLQRARNSLKVKLEKGER